MPKQTQQNYWNWNWIWIFLWFHNLYSTAHHIDCVCAVCVSRFGCETLFGTRLLLLVRWKFVAHIISLGASNFVSYTLFSKKCNLIQCVVLKGTRYRPPSPPQEDVFVGATHSDVEWKTKVRISHTPYAAVVQHLILTSHEPLYLDANQWTAPHCHLLCV